MDVFAAVPKKRGKMPFEDEESETFSSYLFASAMAMSPSSSLGFFLPLLLLLLLFVSLFGGVGANATDSVYIYKAFSSKPLLNAWENHYLNSYKTIIFPFYASYLIAQLLVPLGFKGGLDAPASSSSATPKTKSSSQQFPTIGKQKKSNLLAFSAALTAGVPRRHSTRSESLLRPS